MRLSSFFLFHYSIPSGFFLIHKQVEQIFLVSVTDSADSVFCLSLVNHNMFPKAKIVTWRCPGERSALSGKR